jgi:hypothetical protein
MADPDKHKHKKTNSKDFRTMIATRGRERKQKKGRTRRPSDGLHPMI